MLFEKETREYEWEAKHKDMRSVIAHLKRTNGEKADEVKCKRDEVKRKTRELEDEEDRLIRGEEEVEDETSCTHYCINELKKKLKDL